MDAPIPSTIQPLIDDYLRALESLQAHFYGVYIYGSIALNAFEDMASDIDVIALTQGKWSQDELKQLEAIHMRLIKEYPLGKRLEVLYAPLSGLGKSSREIAPYPGVHDGKFIPSGFNDVNGVTWWILKHRGIRLSGPEREELPFDYEWGQVLFTMRFNLDVYFARQLKRSHIYFFDAGVEFTVTNLCRILTTIEDNEIISKSASLRVWRERLPERWRLLLDESWRIRHHPDQPSLYNNLLRRRRETIAFIRYVRERGDKGLDAANVPQMDSL